MSIADFVMSTSKPPPVNRRSSRALVGTSLQPQVENRVFEISDSKGTPNGPPKSR